MIDGDSILRRLPGLVDAVTRFEVDALVFCYDIMSISLRRVSKLCAEVDPKAISPVEIATLFADAWAIIDQINVARQILRRRNADGAAPVTEAFLNGAEAARIMRNRMDHLPQNIPNRSKQRGGVPPLFGTVSYVRCLTDPSHHANLENIETELVFVGRGDIPGREMTTQITMNTARVRAPISQVRLTAFEQTIDLELAAERLAVILGGYDEGMAASLEREVQRIMKETGASEEDVRAPVVTLFAGVIRQTIKIGRDEPAQLPT